jgi:phospholipase C
MSANSLSSVAHVVTLMLENRFFDHMLGFRYPGNKTPTGQPFEGSTGTESNPDATGTAVGVFRIEPNTPNAYFMPGADPGEGGQPPRTAQHRHADPGVVDRPLRVR